MIFLTVGGQLPFDRLVRAVDAWAAARDRDDVFAQVGRGEFVPRAFPSAAFLGREEFDARAREATAIVAHAGMGTILTALQYGKPIVVLPRREALGEQRNDHQLATARRLRELDKVRVAMDEGELERSLDELDGLSSAPAIGPHASEALLARLRSFVEETARGTQR